jgi:hypothetical protein
MHYDQVILGFAENLVPSVKDGSKTLTYRLGFKYAYLKVGDHFLVENTATHIPFAEIEIMSVSQASFQDLPIDRPGHETYESKEGQRKIFEGFYGTRVKDEDPFLVFEFKVVRLLEV